MIKGILDMIIQPGPCFECIYGPLKATLYSYQASQAGLAGSVDSSALYN